MQFSRLKVRNFWQISKVSHYELTLVAYFYIFSILQNIVTSSKCLVMRALHDHWIWYVTVLWWHHNILEYRKCTEICHQRATHSYLIVAPSESDSQFRRTCASGNISKAGLQFSGLFQFTTYQMRFSAQIVRKCTFKKLFK